LSFGTFVLKFWFTWASGAFLADKYYHNEKNFKNPFIWFIVFYLMFYGFQLNYFTNYFKIIPVTICCLALMEFILHGEFIEKYSIYKLIFKYLSFIGLVSYSVYLIHQPYLNDLLIFFNPGTSIHFINTFVSIILTYLIILIISYSLYKIIEIKSIEFGKIIRRK